MKINLKKESMIMINNSKNKFRNFEIKEIKNKAELEQDKINKKTDNENQMNQLTKERCQIILGEIEEKEDFLRKSLKKQENQNIDFMMEHSSFIYFSELIILFKLKAKNNFKKTLPGKIKRIQSRLKYIESYKGSIYDINDEYLTIYTSISYDKLIKMFLAWGAYESSIRSFDEKGELDLSNKKDESQLKINTVLKIKEINESSLKNNTTFLDYLGQKSSSHRNDGTVDNEGLAINHSFIENINKLKRANYNDISGINNVNLFIIAYNIRNLFAHENFTPNSGTSDARISMLIFEELSNYLLYKTNKRTFKEMEKMHIEFEKYLYKFISESKL